MKKERNLSVILFFMCVFAAWLILTNLETADASANANNTNDSSLERVQKIEAIINCAEFQLPQSVQARIAETVRVVSEKIIIGNKLEEVEAKKNQDEFLLKQGFSLPLLLLP